MYVPLTSYQTAFAIATSGIVFLLLLELIRRRRVREEYAWLWLFTGILMILLVTWPALLRLITRLIGAAAPLTTLLIFSTIFLLAIAVHYSVIISNLTTQVKNLSQELALLEASMRTADSGHEGTSASP
jgi:hypothetical protein